MMDEEYSEKLKQHFNGRFEIDKPIYYEESSFLPIFSIKDNLDNLRYSLKPKMITYGYDNFLIDELTKIVIEKREGIINYILNNDNNNSCSRRK
jgi:hypothetical protein